MGCAIDSDEEPCERQASEAFARRERRLSSAEALLAEGALAKDKDVDVIQQSREWDGAGHSDSEEEEPAIEKHHSESRLRRDKRLTFCEGEHDGAIGDVEVAVVTEGKEWGGGAVDSDEEPCERQASEAFARRERRLSSAEALLAGGALAKDKDVDVIQQSREWDGAGHSDSEEEEPAIEKHHSDSRLKQEERLCMSMGATSFVEAQSVLSASVSASARPQQRLCTWSSQAGLPDNEGQDLPCDDAACRTRSQVRTLEAAKRWCEAQPDCVGFAVRHLPQIRSVAGFDSENSPPLEFFPKKRGTGFDATTAAWTTQPGQEKWEFNYIEGRALPDPAAALPAFAAELPVELGLSLTMQLLRSPKRAGAAVRLKNDGDEQALLRVSPGDRVFFRIVRLEIAGEDVKVPDKEQSGVLGSGELCEALDLALRGGLLACSSARLRTRWAMLATKPPAEVPQPLKVRAASASAPMSDDEVELDIEILRFEPGAEARLGETLGSPPRDTDDPDESAQARTAALAKEVSAAALRAEEEGTRLLTEGRYILALARYLDAGNLLRRVDPLAALEATKESPLLGGGIVSELVGRPGARTAAPKQEALSPVPPDSGDRPSARLAERFGEEAAVEIVSAMVACKLNAAQCYLNLQVWSSALALCDDVLRLDPSSTKARYQKAQALAAQSEYKAAFSELQELLKVDPTNAAARQRLLEVKAQYEESHSAESSRVQRSLPGIAGEEGEARRKLSPEAQVLPATGERQRTERYKEIMEEFEVGFEEAKEIYKNGGL